MTCLCHTRYVETGFMPTGCGCNIHTSEKRNVEIFTEKCSICGIEYRVEFADYSGVRMSRLLFNCLCGKNNGNNYSEDLKKI